MKDEERHPLDDLFRKKLNEDQLPPDDKLWGEIEERLDKKKDRPWLLIFLSIGGLLLISAALIYFVMNNNTATKTITAQETTTEKSVAATNSNPVNAATKPVTSTEKNNLNNNEQKTIIAATSTPSSIGGSVTSPAPVQKTTVSSLSVKKNSKQGGLNNTTNTNLAAASASNEMSNVSSSTQNNISSLPQNNTQPGTALNKGTSVATVTSGVAKADSGISNGISPTPPQKDVTASVAKNETSTDTTSKIVSPSPVKQEKTDVVRKDTVPTQPSAKKSRVSWYAEAGIDIMNNTKTIKATSSADPYYLEKRDAEESAITTFNYTAKVGMQLDHLQIESGFTVYRVGENIQYSDRAICYNLVSAGYYRGTTYVYKYDTINRHLEKNDSVTRKNGRSVNTYVGIPIQALYNFTIKGVKFQAGAGIATLLPAQWNSWYINTSATGLEDPSTLKMLNPILFDANVNAGVVIPLTDSFDAVATLEYRRNLNSVFKSTYGVQQGYSGVGGGVSVRYNFSAK